MRTFMITRKTYRRFFFGVPAMLLLLFGTSARAGYLSETGMIQVVSAPPSLTTGSFQSDSDIRTFVEQQQFVLTSSVSVDDTATGTFTSNASLVGGTIAAGTSLGSYFFHSDPVSASQVYSGSVTFTTAILGVIVLSDSLSATDSQLGHQGTTYPTGDSGRGLELSTTQDFFTLSSDRKTLTFQFNTHDNVDEVRVLTAPTAVPEPSSLALLGLGTLILTGASFRRRLAARVA
jgi:PEP-CTERM motif